MYPHEPRPVAVRLVEKGEFPTVWICPARADKYSFDSRLVLEVVGQRGLHVLIACGEVEVVFLGRGGDKGVDFGEGLERADVQRLEGPRKGRGGSST